MYTKKNQTAIDTVKLNGGMCYPRELATAELTTAKSVQYPINGEIYDVSNISPDELSSKKFYEYSARYGFVFDLITAICTEHPEWVIDDPRSSFYSLKLKRETCEQYALDGLSGLSGEFWDNIIMLAKNPEVFKNIPFMDKDGKLSLITMQPVIVALFRENLQLNSQNAFIGNLKKGTNGLQDLGLITKVEILFFKPLFCGLLQKGSNWIALPKAFTGHIIKVIETHKGDPAMLNKQIRARPSVETVRKAIMYLNMHESENATSQLNIKLIDFCLHVLPSELDICWNDNDRKDGKLYVRNYMRVKEKIELIFYLYNCLHTEHKLKGFKFSTGRVFVDKQNNNIRVLISRDNNTVLEYTLEDNSINFDDIPF